MHKNKTTASLHADQIKLIIQHTSIDLKTKLFSFGMQAVAKNKPLNKQRYHVQHLFWLLLV